MNTIRLSADGSQLVDEMRSVKDSVDDTIGAFGRLNEAQKNGDYSKAAQITHQIDTARLLKPDSSNIPGGLFSGNTGTASYSGMNANKLDIRLELLTKTIDELTHQLEEATEKGQSREAYNISATLNNVEQEKQRLEHEKKLSEQKTDESGAMDMIKRYGLSRYFTQGLGYVQQIAGIGFNRRTAMANGDYLGADVGVLEGASNIAQGLGNTAMGAGMTLGATPAGWLLMGGGGLLSILGTIGNIISGDKKADIAEGEAYERSLVHTGALNRRYAQGGTWEDNANRTSELLEKGTKYAEGTGMSAYGIVDIATQMSQYGAGTSDLALKQASDVAARVNATGVDAATVQNLLGTAWRYGDRGDVLGYASQARQASGMTKAQDKEFLTALQSVIEEGIAGGYVKSIADVSKTMTMFARLSDNNPLWQGAQGASRLRQMDSSIAGATGLQNTSDMIVATAANGILDGKSIKERNKLIHGGATGTYVDTMLLMEQGNNPEMFSQIAKSVQDLEGEGNIAGQIERFKDVFKLNYHGGRDVYNMAQKLNNGEISVQTFQKQIASMQKDAAYQSDDTKRQNAITNIEASVALMAKSKFWEGTATLNKEAEKRTEKNKELADFKSLTDEEKNKTIKQTSSLNKRMEFARETEGTTQQKVDNLIKSKNYAAAADAIMSGESYYFSNFENKGGFYDKLKETGKGNDERDELFKKLLVNYAAFGQNRFYKADSTVDKEELLRVFEAIQLTKEGKAFLSSYEHGDTATFISALETLLTKVFGSITMRLEE